MKSKVVGKLVIKAGFDGKGAMKSLNKFRKQLSKLETQKEKLSKLKSQELKDSNKQTQATKREDKAQIKLKDSLRQIAYIKGRSVELTMNSTRAAKRLVAEYERGERSLESLNSDMRHLIRQTKTAAIEARKLANQQSKGSRSQRQSNYGVGVGKGLAGGLLGGAMIAGGAGAAIGAVLGAGYAGASSVRNASERQQQLDELTRQTQLSEAEAAVLNTTVIQNIPDINTDKLTDIFKDVNDRLGEFTSTYDPSKGKGDGEFNDAWVLLQEAGMTFKELQTLKPTDVFAAIQKAGEKVGVNQERLTFVFESLADEGSKLSRVFKNNSAMVETTRQQMEKYNLTLSDSDRANIRHTAALQRTLSTFTTSLSDSFSSGFGSALGEGENFKQSLASLKVPMFKLGEGVGTLINHFSTHANKLKVLFEPLSRIFTSLKTILTPIMPLFESIVGVGLWGLNKGLGAVATVLEGFISVVTGISGAISASVDWLTDKLSFIPGIGVDKPKAPAVPNTIDVNNVFPASDRLFPNNISNITNTNSTIERVATTGQQTIKVENSLRFDGGRFTDFFHTENRRISQDMDLEVLGNMAR